MVDATPPVTWILFPFSSLSNPLTFSLYIYIYIYFKNLIYYSWCLKQAYCFYYLKRSEEERLERKVWEGQNEEGKRADIYLINCQKYFTEKYQKCKTECEEQ